MAHLRSFLARETKVPSHSQKRIMSHDAHNSWTCLQLRGDIRRGLVSVGRGHASNPCDVGGSSDLLPVARHADFKVIKLPQADSE